MLCQLIGQIPFRFKDVGTNFQASYDLKLLQMIVIPTSEMTLT